MDRPFPSLPFKKKNDKQKFLSALASPYHGRSGLEGRRVHLFRKRDSGLWSLHQLFDPRSHVHALRCHACKSEKSSQEPLDYVADWTVLSLFLPCQFWCVGFCTVSKDQGRGRIVPGVTTEMEGALPFVCSTTASLAAPMFITLGGVARRCLADNGDRRVRRAAQWPSARFCYAFAVLIMQPSAQ